MTWLVVFRMGVVVGVGPGLILYYASQVGLACPARWCWGVHCVVAGKVWGSGSQEPGGVVVGLPSVGVVMGVRAPLGRLGIPQVSVGGYLGIPGHRGLVPCVLDP